MRFGDITTIAADYIAHQCDCTSDRTTREVVNIFQFAPQANTYRHCIRLLGKISIHKTDENKPDVINIYGQYYYGAPAATGNDTETRRRNYFQSALTQIARFLRQLDKQSIKIVFPWKIGCKDAQGNWQTYERMLKDFAASLRNAEQNITVLICKNEQHVAKRNIQREKTTADSPDASRSRKNEH